MEGKMEFEVSGFNSENKRKITKGKYFRKNHF